MPCAQRLSVRCTAIAQPCVELGGFLHCWPRIRGTATKRQLSSGNAVISPIASQTEPPGRYLPALCPSAFHIFERDVRRHPRSDSADRSVHLIGSERDRGSVQTPRANDPHRSSRSRCCSSEGGFPVLHWERQASINRTGHPRGRVRHRDLRCAGQSPL